MIAFFTNWAEIAAIFAVLDYIVKDRHKDVVAQYIFGFKEVSYKDFEISLTKTVLNFFSKNEKVSIIRVLILSVTISSIVSMNAIINGYGGGTPLGKILLYFLPISGVFSFILDFVSIYITFKIFKRIENLGAVKYIFLVFVDMFITIVIYGCAIFVIFELFPVVKQIPGRFEGGEYYNLILFGCMLLLYFLLGGFIISIISSVFINIIQIVIIFFGFIVRTLIVYGYIGRLLVDNSKINNYPFSFIGLIFGFVVSIIAI